MYSSSSNNYVKIKSQPEIDEIMNLFTLGESVIITKIKNRVSIKAN